MTVSLNHTLVPARDIDASASFLANLLGLPPPRRLGHFAVVQIGDTSLDFIADDGDIEAHHYAFLVSDAEFDEIFARIQAWALPYWSDPARKQHGDINHWDDGRGVYFDDPNGHLLEVITRAYGNGGTVAEHPHPLVMPAIETPGEQRS